MNALLKEKVDLMVDNYQELKSPFKWEMHIVRHFSALIHATKSKKVNIDKLEEIKQYIKNETGWASSFRGTNMFLLASLLTLEEDYKRFFTDMKKVFEKLKDKGFQRNIYLPLAAYTIVKEVEEYQWQNKIERVREMYLKMKKNHFWITSHDDYVLAAVLGVSNLDIESTSENIEKCYKYLNNEGFWKGNDLQGLSHVLAIGEEDIDTKCKKASELYNRLKEVDCKLNYSGLTTLGVLTLVSNDTRDIVRDVKEVYEYLYEKTGYGSWKLQKSMRIILAATLVSDFYVDEIKKGVLQVALGNSINSIIIAQQQSAVVAACAASTAAASSSS